MIRKIIVLNLSAAILCCCCLSLTSGMPTFNMETLRARARMSQAIIEEYTEFMIDTLKNNNHILQAVLDDPTIKDNDDLGASTFFLKSTVNKIDDLEKDKFMYMAMYPMISSFDYAEYLDFIKKYNTEPKEGYVSHYEVFKAALEKNGVRPNQMKKNLVDSFKSDTVPKIKRIIGDYVTSLSSNEKTNQNDVVEFYEKFKAENDAEKLYDMFDTFLKDEKDTLMSTKRRMHF